MAIGTIIAIGAAIATGVGAFISHKGQKKAAKAARRNEALRRRQQQLEAARERRKVIRDAAIRRAEAISSAGYAGALGGSSVEGVLAGISGTVGSNVHGINQGDTISQGIFSNNQTISRANQQVAFGQAISSLGGAAVNTFQNFGSLA